MGERVRVAPGRGVKEQQLQRVDVVEVVETVTAEAFLHPLPVSVVDAHAFRLLPFYYICFSSGIAA